MTAHVINADPNLKGIGCMAGGRVLIDVKTANARKIPIVLEDKHPRTSVILATGDLTIAMLLALAYRLVDADRYTRCGKFRQEQTIALMGLAAGTGTVGLMGMGKLALYMVPRLVWLGSARVYESPGRNALDEFFKHEPFRANVLYERIEIYHWQCGTMAP